MLVKRNAKRTVYYLPPDGDKPGLYFKHDRPSDLANLLKAWIRCKSAREFRASERLREANVPVASPVAWGIAADRSSWVVTDELAHSQSFMNAWEEVRNHPAERRLFIDALSHFIQTLVSAGVSHPDMHAGNVVVQSPSADRAFHFFLIDTIGVRTGKKMTVRCRRRLLKWLSCLADDLQHADIKRLFHSPTVRESGRSAYQMWLVLVRAQSRFDDRKWAGRRKRLMRDSSLCDCHRTEQGIWRLVESFPLTVARSCVDCHMADDTSSRVIKDDRKRRISRVRTHAASYVVKQFKRPRRLSWWATDCKSYLNTCRLAKKMPGAVHCHGWLRTSEPQGFLVLEDAGPDYLTEVLRRVDVKRGRLLLYAAARMIARLHQREILHGDLKPTNFVLYADSDSGHATLALVDADSVQFGVRMTLRKRSKNLSQFLELVLPLVSRAMKWRVLVWYGQEAGLTAEDIRKLEHLIRARLAVVITD